MSSCRALWNACTFVENTWSTSFHYMNKTHEINLLLTEQDGRTGKYWFEVVALRTQRRQLRTKPTEGQYFPVRLERVRLVSSLLYGTRFSSGFSKTNNALLITVPVAKSRPIKNQSQSSDLPYDCLPTNNR